MYRYFNKQYDQKKYKKFRSTLKAPHRSFPYIQGGGVFCCVCCVIVLISQLLAVAVSVFVLWSFLCCVVRCSLAN